MLSAFVFEACRFVSLFGKQVGCHKSFFFLSAFPRDDCPRCVTAALIPNGREKFSVQKMP